MCVDPTESYGLMLVTHALYEKVIRKSPIICVIVFDGFPVLARVGLECGLSFYRLLGCNTLLEVYAFLSRPMVDEYCCVVVPSPG